MPSATIVAMCERAPQQGEAHPPIKRTGAGGARSAGLSSSAECCAAMAGNAGLRGQLPLPDGVTVAGEWDEAKALNCRTQKM